MNLKIQLFLLLFLGYWATLSSQQESFGPHDFGRMWTFENPPREWFKQAYDFQPDDAWFEDVRKSSLRFASWCSGSFVSADGLIMTNHHCSRDASMQVERSGENFSANGFYAATREDERRVAGLFVEQLIQAEDITPRVNALLAQGESRGSAIEQVRESYRKLSDWQGLRFQVVEYYNGAQIALHGYKRFEDIRLVLVPEVAIGFFGGEADNFTYPRYNLDFTFWRAYDDNGLPVNSSEHYFRFNPNGPDELEPVFALGTPASTERYKTVAQLDFDRDYRFPMVLNFLETLYATVEKQIEISPTEQLMSQLFYLSNSIKVYKGILKGLHDPVLYGRKVAMENYLKQKTGQGVIWDQIAAELEVLKPHAWAINLLGPTPQKGHSFLMLHALAKYERQIREQAPESELEITREEIRDLSSELGTESDRSSFIQTLTLMARFIPGDNEVLKDLMGQNDPASYVDHLFRKSKIYDPNKLQKLLELKPGKFLKKDDPMLRASRNLVGAYEEAARLFVEKQPVLAERQRKIASLTYEVYGESLTPDATFTLRISDGVVKGYGYNGTEAPYKTSFFGMYDRFYSHGGKNGWELPEKWQHPEMAMLSVPLNFVSTNDIIGGNSGSAIINREKEVVGLIFDGNIESLPGNFIFDEGTNRAVSVHSAGILAALRYVYHADRIYAELLDKK